MGVNLGSACQKHLLQSLNWKLVSKEAWLGTESTQTCLELWVFQAQSLVIQPSWKFCELSNFFFFLSIFSLFFFQFQIKIFPFENSYIEI